MDASANKEEAVGTSSEAGDRDKSHRYGSSCTTCRRRKQKCDAGYPICGRCSKNGEKCVYEGNQRKINAGSLIPLISDLLSFLSELSSTESGVEEPTRERISSYLETIEIPDHVRNMIGTSTSRSGHEGRAGPSTQGLAGQDDLSDTGERRTVTRTVGEPDADGGQDGSVDELLMHMSLAEDGQNRHFGVTSFLWQTPSASVLERLQNQIADDRSAPGGTSDEDPALGRTRGGRAGDVWATEAVTAKSPGGSNEVGLLKANASMLSNWESLAFHKLELEHDHQSAKMIVHLLKTFFAWQYGQHCVVYRPVFLRDMALGGSYFNKFLLNVICTSAARVSDYHVGDSSPGQLPGFRTPARDCGLDYLATAKMLLAQEMDKPSSIPTIQGLLLLGQRECSCGNLSQGWQYTGMAFRAMRDLGIHLNVSRLPMFGYGTLSIEDREIRRRLFWAAYTWDKVISLALGRTPTFNAWTNVSPGPIMDDTEDDDDWYPHFWDQSLYLEMADYPKQKALTTANNRNYIKLSEIIQKIIMRLYNGRPRIETSLEFTKDIRQKLSTWFAQLPPAIKLDAAHLPEHCPPPHIFMTNCLYRATLILLYRLFLQYDVPFRFHAPPELAEEAAFTCTQQAEELDLLFRLYNKSFKLRNMTYTTSWSMYSAATINAMDFRNPNPDIAARASPRLVFSLYVLDKGALHSPGIERSIELIKQRLKAPAPRLPKRQAVEADYDTAGGSKRKLVTGRGSASSNNGEESSLGVASASSQSDWVGYPQLSTIGNATETQLTAPVSQSNAMMGGGFAPYPNQQSTAVGFGLNQEDDFMRLMADLEASGSVAQPAISLNSGAGIGMDGMAGFDMMQGMMAMPATTSAETQWALEDWAKLWNIE